jgi:hypothetical protein
MPAIAIIDKQEAAVYISMNQPKETASRRHEWSKKSTPIRTFKAAIPSKIKAMLKDREYVLHIVFFTLFNLYF